MVVVMDQEISLVGSSAQGRRSNTGRYMECLRNHAAAIGGNARDGCLEFLAAGLDGTPEFLKCAVCRCHRNFHRKDTDMVAAGKHIPTHHHQEGPPHQEFAMVYQPLTKFQGQVVPPQLSLAQSMRCSSRDGGEGPHNLKEQEKRVDPTTIINDNAATEAPENKGKKRKMSGTTEKLAASEHTKCPIHHPQPVLIYRPLPRFERQSMSPQLSSTLSMLPRGGERGDGSHNHQGKEETVNSITNINNNAVAVVKAPNKNQVAAIGGTAHNDGRELLAIGHQGTPEAFKCVFCHCHQSLHQKEINMGVTSDRVTFTSRPQVPPHHQFVSVYQPLPRFERHVVPLQLSLAQSTSPIGEKESEGAHNLKGKEGIADPTTNNNNNAATKAPEDEVLNQIQQGAKAKDVGYGGDAGMKN